MTVAKRGYIAAIFCTLLAFGSMFFVQDFSRRSAAFDAAPEESSTGTVLSVRFVPAHSENRSSVRSNGTTYGHTTINTPDAFHVRVQFEEGRRVGTHVDYVVNEGMRASAEQMYTPGAPVVVRYKASLFSGAKSGR